MPAFYRFADHIGGEIQNIRQAVPEPARIAVACGVKSTHQQRYEKDQQHQIHPAL